MDSNTGPAGELTVGTPDIGRGGIWNLLFLSGCFFAIVHDPTASLLPTNVTPEFYATAGRGSTIRQIAFMLIGLWGVLGYRDIINKPLRRIGAGGNLSIAMLTWVLVSLFWSAAPSDSATRLIGVLVLVLGSLRLRSRFTARQVILWVTSTTLSFIAVGIVCEVVLGTFKPWIAEYRLFGTLSPNEQGVNCSIAVLGSYWLRREGTSRGIWTILLAFACVCDFLTKSRTALAAVGLTMLICIFVAYRNRAKRLLFVSLCALTLTACIWLESNQFLSFTGGVDLGRDQETADASNLTGRMPLWNEIMLFAKDRQLGGFGFGGFWTTGRIFVISEDQGWGISGSHSSYVEMLVSTGYVGLMLYCIVLLSGLLLASRSFLRSRRIDSAFFGSLFLFITINGLADSESVNVSGFLCFCFILGQLYLFFESEQHVGSGSALPGLSDPPELAARPQAIP